MLVQFDSNNIINTARIDSVTKLSDNRVLVHVGDRQIRLELSIRKFLELSNQNGPTLLTEEA